MTKYLDPTFTVVPGANKAYRDNYEKRNLLMKQLFFQKIA